MSRWHYIVIIFIVKVLLFVPQIAQAKSYVQIDTYVDSFLEMDTTPLPAAPQGNYDVEAGYGDVSAVMAATFYNGGSCLGPGCTVPNPYPVTIPATSTLGYWAGVYITANDTVYYGLWDVSGGNWQGNASSTVCDSNPVTRILDFNPQDGTTTTSGVPVNFDLSACISPDDIGTVKGINITLHNIDQNVLLVSSLSPNDIYLLQDTDIQTSGLYTFSTSTTLADGNYRLEACIEQSYFWGFIINPFSGNTDCTSHQFVVGSSTFIGGVSANLFNETQSLFASTSATSSAALAAYCSPLGNFSIAYCLSYLFIPDGNELNQTIQYARDGILTRLPWGYFTRTLDILTNSATSSLPSFTATIQIGPGDDLSPATTSLTFDTQDMIAGAGAVLDSITDPIHGKSVRDVFEPLVRLAVALAVLFTIIYDLMGRGNEPQIAERRGKAT